MMPRPLIRWKSFWLGIVVLGFLGWAWVRSMLEIDLAFIMTDGGWTLGIDHGSGSIGFSLTHENRVSAGFNYSTVDYETTTWFKQPFTIDGAVVEFAHWFVILLLFLSWSAFLGWRWQRQRKHTA